MYIIAWTGHIENGYSVKSHILFVMKRSEMQQNNAVRYLYEWKTFIGNLDLECLIAGKVRDRLVWTRRSRFSGDPYFRFYLPLKGTFELVYASEKTVEVRPGEWYLIPPETPFRFRGIVPSTHFWLHFFSRQLTKIPGLITPCSAPVVEPEKAEKNFLELMEKIQICRSLEEAEEVRHRIVKMILPVVERALERVEYKTVQEGQFAKILDYIDRNLHREIRVEELKRFLSLPRAKFSSEFHRVFGVPPKQYITLRRIGRAKYLLIRTRLTVKEIALETGFANEFFFSKVFKKYTNHAPSEYRTGLDCGKFSF